MKLQEKYKETSRNQGMEEEAPVTHFSKIKTFIGNRSGFHELWRNGWEDIKMKKKKKDQRFTEDFPDLGRMGRYCLYLKRASIII